MFDELAHPTLGDTTSTKDLYRILCSLLCRLRRIHLQERNLSKKKQVMSAPVELKKSYRERNTTTYPASFCACSFYAMLPI